MTTINLLAVSVEQNALVKGHHLTVMQETLCCSRGKGTSLFPYLP